MSTKLIALLTRHAKLTPDEIAAKVANKGWIKGSEFTKAERDRMMRKQVMLCIHNKGESNHNYLWGPQEYLFDWSLRDLKNSLYNYYFILVEDYTDGELPQPT